MGQEHFDRRAEREAQRQQLNRLLTEARAKGEVTRADLAKLATAMMKTPQGTLERKRKHLKAKEKSLAKIDKINARKAQQVRWNGLSEDDQCVYVIGAPNQPVKIGIAVRPESRLRELQTGSAHALHLYFHTDALSGSARAIERECHKRLEAHRLSGEWFSIDAEAAIETVKAALARRQT